MIPLYTDEEFKNSKSRDLLKLQCQYCHKEFYMTKNFVQANKKKNSNLYCSIKCRGLANQSRIIVHCSQCNKEIIRNPSQISKNNFCNHKCSATYQNTHKTTGNRRSKLEIYIEQQLKSLYPNLEILFNDKQTINSELDIYIPSLKLAFELNGLFHYEPVFGQDKLDKIQNNDHRKFAACNENNISLCIIDTSQQKYVKEHTCLKYLNIITNIINSTKIN